jgi:hypothetical protein
MEAGELIMRSLSVVPIAAAVLASCLTLLAAGDQDNASAKRAPPPTKWDSRVTDVFFPDARKVLVGPRPTYAASGAKADGASKEAASASQKGTSGTFAWSKLISADELQNEVKSLSTSLADAVKTQQGFLGGGSKKARQSLSQLAAAFAILNEYDGEIRWKDQAAVARDLFAKAGYNSKAATEATFREAKSRSDDLAALLRGESITTPANVEPKNDWSKVSNLSPLMLRLEAAQRDRISAATSNPGEFKKNAPQLSHESEIVAAFAEVLSRPGMDNADDDKFRGFAKALQQSAVDLRAAVKNDNYDSARAAAGTMAKTCTNCHADFR